MRKTLLGVFLCLTGLLGAQETKSLYQIIELNDSVGQIGMDIFSDFETEVWEGNVVMVEWRVELFGATEGILNFLIGQQRYHLDTAPEGDVLRLRQAAERFRPIETRNGPLTELIRIKLFIPKDFAPAGPNRWQRLTPGIKEEH